MAKNLFLSICLILQVGCIHQDKEVKPLRWLEDIPFNSDLDDENFIICQGEEKIYQYFNVGDNLAIEGDKPKIISHFKNGYEHIKMPSESGFIRIRFIVNCNGETDRFRMLEGDLNYKTKTFSKKISQQILALTKSLKGWQQKIEDGAPVDYYQYLIFRIENGKIIKILP